MSTNNKQTDSRWSAVGFAGETMYSTGCGPAAVDDVLESKCEGQQIYHQTKII